MRQKGAPTNIEVEGGNREVGSGGGKKWIIEEDCFLVHSWINTSATSIMGTNQRKLSFWGKVVIAFNKYDPAGIARRTRKIYNTCWNRASIGSQVDWLCG